MSKRQFKSQASSSRAAPSGGLGGFGGFGGPSSQSSLSYLTEPPNYSSIIDPNVVVSFKNLSKKDRATKNRGLEDLRSYIQAHPFEQDGGVEEAILEVWVQLYPRTAIDNDRNVRELSHEVQFELAKSTRKRIEKYIPKIVGTWLAGTSDRDRGVSKMAQEGIKSLFNSEDKYRAFLKRCQSPILDYAIEATKETPATLSDERNTSSDDMDAKYFRVLFSGIWQVLNLFSNLREEDISKCQDKYEEFLSSNEDLWSLVASKDALVRKSICELLILCLKFQKETVEKDLPRIVQAFAEKGLRAGQSTTAKILLDTLKSLETIFPGIWTPKSLKYLRKFIEKGTQGGGSEYWTSLESVIKLIPPPLLPSDLATSREFFHSFRVGIKNSREGIRDTSSATWPSYIHVAKLLGENLQDPNTQAIFYQEVVFPVFQNYLQPTADGTQDNSRWSISDPSIVAEAYSLFTSLQEAEKDADAKNLFLDQWRDLVDNIIIQLRTSLPEQSKEYHRSQKDVAAESCRWFSLLQFVHSNSTTGSADLAPSNPDLLVNASIQILNSAVELLVTRQGKPYSAAETLLEAIKGSLSVKSDLQAGKSPLGNWFRTAISSVKSFLEKNLATLVLSPSGPSLISSLHILFLLPEQAEGCDKIWNSAVDSVLAASGSDDKFETLAGLIYNKATSPHCPSYLVDDDDSKAFTSHLVDLIHAHPALQLYLLEVAVKDLEHEALSKFRQVVSHNSLTKSSTTTLLERITKHLEHNKRSNHALKAFAIIFDKTPESLIEESEMSSRYITLFMIITDIPPGQSTPLWATTAQMLLLDMIKFVCSKSHEQPVEKSVVFKLIRENLRKHARNSLSPFVLFRCAMIFIQNTPPPCINTVITSLFPTPDDWHKSLGPLFWNSPQDCLSMFNSLNGAASLVEKDTAEENKQSPASFLPFDIRGDPIDALNCSFRFAVYTANLLLQKEVMTKLPLALHVELLYHLLLFVEVAEDSLDGLSNGLQLYTCPWEEETVEALMGPADGCLNAVIDEAGLWHGGTDSEIPNLFDGLVHKCMELNNPTTPAFYASRVLYRLLNEHSKKYGWRTLVGDKWLSSLRVGFSSSSERKFSHGTFFTTLAILNGLGPHLAESPVIKTLFRQLVNQIADNKTEDMHLQDSLLCLVTLNACFDIYGWSGYDDVPELPFTNSRQPIFAVKQILSWTTAPHIEGTAVATESCRVLRKLLPVISEVYGSYWDDTLSFCMRIWSTAVGSAVTPENLSELYESVELVAKVSELSKGDNEDVHEAYTEHQEEISESLILLVQLPRDESLFLKRGPSRTFVGVPEITNWSFNTPCRPLRKFDSILSKCISSVPLEYINDLEDLYPLIASESYLIQSTAFDLLSKALPEKQQQLSVDVILNKHDARLPDELLSLLLDAPTILKFNDEELAQYPSSIRTYLLSWQLVFTSYHQASEKVRNDYTLMLKSENCIGPLLNFLSDALGHSAANALNLAKESIPPNLIRSYNWKVGEKKAPEADMQYLLVNLYYLALFYTPQLVREWYIDCQSKQTRIAIENWTEKFFSPLVIEDSMNAITDWAENQEEIDDEKKLIVKVSRKSREIFASYEVDETAIQIVIRLRENYPLDGVKVDGVNRVAVSEKKFQSWLISIQGLITFSNGYIPNGLAAFRKNVSGTLKGTEECAICYSIISADNKIPDKRCTTCSNLFHGSCLFKWFKSSNQSTCPLCRNPFNYGTKLPLR